MPVTASSHGHAMEVINYIGSFVAPLNVKITLNVKNQR